MIMRHAAWESRLAFRDHRLWPQVPASWAKVSLRHRLWRIGCKTDQIYPPTASERRSPTPTKIASHAPSAKRIRLGRPIGAIARRQFFQSPGGNRCLPRGLRVLKVALGSLALAIEQGSGTVLPGDRLSSPGRCSGAGPGIRHGVGTIGRAVALLRKTMAGNGRRQDSPARQKQLSRDVASR